MTEGTARRRHEAAQRWQFMELAAEPGRVTLRGTAVVRLRRETVEVWAGDRCHGSFDREGLTAWSARPRDWVEV